MARQITYGVDREVHAGDQWLITDQVDGGTKNLTVSTLAKYFAQSGVADPNRIGFHYTHAPANGSVSTGQFRYIFDSINLSAGTVTGIQLHRYSSRGVDFNPITNILEGVDIKITDITDSTNTNYAIYSTSTHTILNDVITINLTLRAASGPLPQGETVLTTLGNFSNSFSGGTIRDGVDNPNGLVQGQAGDVYFHIRTADNELDFYGPLPVANTAPTYEWGDPIQLKGEDGLAVNYVTGVQRADDSGTDLTFYVNTNTMSPDPADAILQTVFVPAGPAGRDGDTITVTETTTGTPTTDGELTIVVTDADGVPTTTTATLPHGVEGASVVIVSDEEVNVGGTEFLRVHYTIGGVPGMFDIPLAADGNHGRGVDRIYSESIGGTPEQFNIYVDYVNPVSTRNLVGTLTNGMDGAPGTAGDTVVFTETTTGDETTDGVLTIVTTHADATTTTETVTIPHGAAGPTLTVDGDNATILNFTGAGVSTDVTAGTATVTIDDELPTTATTNEVLTWTGAAWEAQGFTIRETGDADTPISNINAIRFAGTGVDIAPGIAGEAVVTIQGGGHPDTPTLDARLVLGSQRHQEDAGTNTWGYTFTFNSADGFSVSAVAITVDNAEYLVSPTGGVPANTAWSITNTQTGETSANVTATITYQEPGDTTNRTATVSGGAISKYISSYWFIQASDTIGLIDDTNDFELTTTTSETVTIANSDVGMYLVVATPTGEYPKISTHPDGTPYVLDPAQTTVFNSITYDAYILEITAGVDLYIKR